MLKPSSEVKSLDFFSVCNGIKRQLAYGGPYAPCCTDQRNIIFCVNKKFLKCQHESMFCLKEKILASKAG
jgi:hypothetical protein